MFLVYAITSRWVKHGPNVLLTPVSHPANHCLWLDAPSNNVQDARSVPLNFVMPHHCVFIAFRKLSLLLSIGVRQEQDLYIRLIDSATKQVTESM